MSKFAVFLGGAIVGAAAEALLTPVRGEELRYRIKANLQKRGLLPSDNVDEFVEMLASEIEEKK